MFYSYDLSFDRASSLSHALSLTVVNAETSHAGTRKNGNPVVLSVTEPQTICGGADPFSGDFSSDFGGGGGYVLVTVNKLLSLAGAQVGFLSEPPTRFHVNTQSALASSSQAAKVSSLHFAAMVLAVLSGQVIALRVARPFHVIVATANAAIYRVVKAITKGALHALDAETSMMAHAIGHTLGSVSAQALQTLYKVVGLLPASSHAQASILYNATSKLHSAVSSEVAAIFRALGKPLGWVDAEVASVTRGLPWHINASSGESPRLSFGGGNLFARVFGAPSGEAGGLQRGLVVQRGALEANAAGAVKAPGKVAASLEAEAVALLKQPGAQRGAIDGQAIASRRQAGLVRSSVTPAIQAIQTAGAHFLGVLSAIDAQVAAAFQQHVIGRSLSIMRTQSSSVSVSSLRTLLRTISVGTSQSVAVVRGMARSMSTIMAAVQNLARSPGKIFATTSTAIASLIFLARHFFISGVVSPEAVQQRASHSAVKAATTAQVAAVIRQHGQFLTAIGASVASLGRALVKALAAVDVQSVTAGRLIGRSFAVVASEVAAAIKSMPRSPSVVSPESSASITRKGSSLGAISTAQIAALRNLTGKFALAFSQMATAGGRGGFKKIGATSPTEASMIRPRGFILPTSQGQAATSVVYYHFFVAPWAYQQTSLLPPSGGPAEPPSFGPIDPADQTIFGFDWASRAYPNDPIMSAVVTCVPPGLPFLPGSLFINGTLIEITVSPFPELVLPTVFSLRCTAKFASGRVSSFSIPVPVRIL